ncbi:hypothetical protein [Salmonella enterica]|uniref:hypothetical protein n=1 Tax=Salmonella enterica TaxID=28901 RepID=UPI0034528965
MSMTVVPFDYTLPVRYRDRVTHYLKHQVPGDDCDDVFSPVPYNLPPVFSADLLNGLRQAGDALLQRPFMPVMVEVSTAVKMLLDSELFFLIFGPEVLYVSAGRSPGQKEKHRILLKLRFPGEDDEPAAEHAPEGVATASFNRHLTDWCAFQDAVMQKKAGNLARGRLLSQVLKWQPQRRDFPATAWGAMMQRMLPPDEKVPEQVLSRVAPELMRLFRDGLKRVTEGEMALFRGCSLKTLREYPLLRTLTDGVLADDAGTLMQYRSAWLNAASVWLRDMMLTVHTLAPSAETDRTAMLVLAFDDFHALVHATAYEHAVSTLEDDGSDLLSVPLSAEDAVRQGKVIRMKNAGAPQMTLPEHNPAVPQGLVLPWPEMEQMHFVMKDNHHIFLLSLKNILLCLREAEKQGEVPQIDEAWWDTLSWSYPDILSADSRDTDPL